MDSLGERVGPRVLCTDVFAREWSRVLYAPCPW
jgi:hypothetical protein